MKILGICGSGRKSGSNSQWMVKTVLEAAKKKGSEVELINIRDYDIKFCDGCDTCCSIRNECVINDDMQGIYKKLEEADGLVFGSPNYFRNVSGLMKNFMDRTDALYAPKKILEGKSVVGVCVGGQDFSDTAHTEKALRNYFEIHKIKIVEMIMARADDPDELKKNKKVEEQLVKAGEKLFLELKK